MKTPASPVILKGNQRNNGTVCRACPVRNREGCRSINTLAVYARADGGTNSGKYVSDVFLAYAKTEEEAPEAVEA